ncbi:adenosylcobinamide-GDP ribazoletransferase [Paraburkholderia bonniea]|uniref:adenosylcobinamide-GDP ribazoletransferase n=1 Tax=Paraburkholderia bonniea TaxID=2152891 RepID=UPI001580A8B0|nr:adenosylcobinamide-GDP ribazoletransferase [Paraburkholderia bonniea]WJF91432.1 adenosylcobinamide-GDP ribazoletransferase [Paraburkholderia bonniea]WJF94751.1 adenosylcobinamide-GDP ribazoletransferase [Paraburkholderia bonniea]
MRLRLLLRWLRPLLMELRYLLSAMGYFTRIPVPRWVGYEAYYLNASARYFPLVGALVGALGAVVYLGALRLWPANVAVLLSLAATLLVTGAFHEDGLADSVDAFGGAYTRDDTLRIMHDSRIGAFGALALLVVLGLKWQVLAALPPARAAWLMIGAHAASRMGAISYLLTLDYVRPEGRAKPVAQRLSWRAMAWAGSTGGLWLLWPDWRMGLVALLVLLLLRIGLGRYFVRRLGGYTGDCLGMAQQVFELAIYLVGLAWISS